MSTDLQRRAQARYNRTYLERLRTGAAEPVSIIEPRRHVRLLRARGWTLDQISTAARMGRAQVKRVTRKDLLTVPRDRATRILAITPVWQATALSVPFLGTGRRLDALAWQGWSERRIEAHLGLCGFVFYHARAAGTCRASTAAALAEFFDQHAHLPGPDPLHARAARRRGAVPAWAWDDDIAIDTPAARPSGVRKDTAS